MKDSAHNNKFPIPVVTYIAIMSVCFIINLPGVAVAPIEGKLKGILHISQLEVQLLTTLPNFVIIPFVLLAGKLSEYKHKVALSGIAIALFVASGVIYLCAQDMAVMIVASCILGVADGILIPFAMGFIVNSFEGKYRTRNLGVKSAVSNLGTVVAGFVVGWLITGQDWHLPFLVYLVAVVPLALCYWLKYIPGFGVVPLRHDPYNSAPASSSTGSAVSTDTPDAPAQGPSKSKLPDIEGKKIWGLIGNNCFVTFVTFAIVLYFPQLIQEYGWSPKVAGYIMSVFFIAVLSVGFVLPYILRLFKSFTFPLIGLLLIIGFGLIVFVREEWAMFCGSIFAGWAFGITQPLIYDKTSYAIHNPARNIEGLAYVLCALYIGIAAEPFIITGITRLFGIKDENMFSFNLSFYMAIAYLIGSFFLRKKFPFSIEKAYYSE